jgi:7,8-dihydro-6-hydroxymethylpterin dimethyltransferase
LNISTTLVVTVQKGLNNGEIGKIIEFGLANPCVRGVTLQPVQSAGRLENFDPATDRYNLTDIRRDILEQTGIFQPDDVLPVPCNPDCLAMAYALKVDGKVYPLTRHINPDDLLNSSKNTIVYEQDKHLREKAISLFSTANSPESAGQKLKQLLCCLPGIAAPSLTYENVFRVIIMQFLDKYNFDVRVAKKSCVHIVNKDGKIIPFDTMNLFYRDGNAAKLETIRKRIRPEPAHA